MFEIRHISVHQYFCTSCTIQLKIRIKDMCFWSDLSLILCSHRPCSALCNPLSCSPGPESVLSIISLSCTGGKPPLNLVGSKSPFPFLTALLFLINSITHIHKGLISKVRIDFLAINSMWMVVYLGGRLVFVYSQA